MNSTARDRDYHPSLRKLWEFVDGTTYAKDCVFTQEKMLTMTPAHIVGWFSKMAYGKANPPLDARPTGVRSNTLLNHKKKISHFHPQKDQQ